MRETIIEFVMILNEKCLVHDDVVRCVCVFVCECCTLSTWRAMLLILFDLQGNG